MKRRLILLSLLSALLISVASPSFAGRARAAVPVTANAPSIAAQPAATHPVPAQPAATHTGEGRIAFVIHAGVAFFLFHHVYKNFKRGYYHGFHPIRWSAAAAEVLLGVHEVRKALDSANSSNSAILHALAKPLNALYGAMGALRSNISSGNFNPSQFSSIDSNVTSFERQAAQNGLPIVESATGQ